MKLFDYQIEALKEADFFDNVAFYHDCGLGKTFTGSEQLDRYGMENNIVVCQKSKINDWINHFKTYYPEYLVFNGRSVSHFWECTKKVIYVVNYDLIYRREIVFNNFTLLLDESSLIQNQKAKRTKAILALKKRAKHVILLSGTPTAGKYERLVSQMNLLGDDITRKEMLDNYCIVSYLMIPGVPYPIEQIDGYKHVKELKERLKKIGVQFLKAEEVVSLPEKRFEKIICSQPSFYEVFKKVRFVNVTFDGVKKELVPENSLHALMIERQLSSLYNKDKYEKFVDILDSIPDRVVVFYNFNEELLQLKKLVKNRKISVINGLRKDLKAYEEEDDSVTFVQYQAGSMGLNLQWANKVIYFSLPLSAELWMQSQERIHRIGQNKKCLYYVLLCDDSVEFKILDKLEKGVDYTLKLFEKDLGEEK